MLKKEDYEEPVCPLCPPDKRAPIDVGRMLSRLDALLDKNDTDAARRHLDYWLAEAESVGDLRGTVTVLNEQMGLFRKCGMEKEAKAAAAAAEAAVVRGGLTDTLSAATVRLNHATVCAAFGEVKEAISLYRSVLTVYERELSPTDTRTAALQNNLAAALVQTKNYKEAAERYRAALAIVESTPEGYPDAAITYLNLADLALAERGCEDAAEEIAELCLLADTRLSDLRVPRDGYLAFVADKCAAAFRYHGFFRLAEKYATLSQTLYGGAEK